MPNHASAIAAHLSEFAAVHSRRRDVIVRVDNTLNGRAQFDRSTAQITVNLNRILDPGERTQLQATPAHAIEYTALVGVLVHEIGHADHTPRRALPAHLERWAAVLEEARIERIMLERNPDWQTPLAASAAAVTRHPRSGDTIGAIELLALLGGRTHARVFPAAKTAAPLEQAAQFLDSHDAQKVLEIAAAAADLADTGHEAMAQLAGRLYEIVVQYSTAGAAATDLLGHVAAGGSTDQPDTAQAQRTSSSNDEHHTRSAGETTGPGEGSGPLRSPTPKHSGGNANVSVVRNPGFYSGSLGAGRARDWFTVTTLPASQSSTRPASALDHQKVRRLGSWLAGQYTPAEVTGTITAAAPPGSARMAELVRATAQHDLGLQVTAAPWRRRRTREQPTTPVDLGLIVDRSTSMAEHLAAAADTAWTLTQALTGTVGRAQTWVFGDRAHTLPAADRTRIITPVPAGTTLALLPAVLDYARWSRPNGAARMLVVLSDGGLQGDPVRQELERLTEQGVSVIGLAPTTGSVAALAHHLPAEASVTALGSDLLAQITGMLKR